VSVFKGKGDYTFKDRNLFGRDVRKLTLILAKANLEYRFEWEFAGWAPDAPLPRKDETIIGAPPAF
jgi:hypothetical protein